MEFSWDASQQIPPTSRVYSWTSGSPNLFAHRNIDANNLVGATTLSRARDIYRGRYGGPQLDPNPRLHGVRLPNKFVIRPV